VFVHCLTENGAMMHLARKNRMRIIPAGGETDARLALDRPRRTRSSPNGSTSTTRATVTAVRDHARFARTLLGYFA
jgi:hypothetical protein